MKPLAVIVACSLLAGCAGSGKTEKSEGSSFEIELHKYEEEFSPSDHGPEVNVFFADLRKEKGETSAPDATTVEPPVIVQGYRVQILATSQIDDANQTKAAAESAFPGEWFYIAFDPPAYKVRVGNFLTRSEADAFSKLLAERGYADAWVVPEKVFKNPKPRPAHRPDEQERPFE